ncbi:hypothetical protein NP233_g12136 [Leucocoprinus birnbaumii]|uniref:NACHT domain-containing protein n=1 Tax=Leucocoprinus birnbaumii TaxID=56174 RepID=A0AAD5VKQ3_9AGAR|nr:hypothetical protein NP233_g12136 [Leucocoprinus birnbaumii]
MAHRHFFIVLDGIDECQGRDAQREIVNMIYTCAHKDHDARFRWMLCSRPEPHLVAAFAAMENKRICHQEKLEVDDPEAQRDALRILKKGFAEIRARDPYQFGPGWPKEDEVQFIAQRASGHLGFASFIIRFIGDIDHDDPARKLNVCLDLLHRSSGISAGGNPLDALDFLYTQILSDIPKDILDTTKRVLGVLICGNEKISAILLANLLGLDRASFYSSLQRLHSVLLIPFPEKAHESSIKVYHASFSDYLTDRSRAGIFFLDEGAVNSILVVRWFEWLSHFSKEPPRPPPEPRWVPELRSARFIINKLCDYSFRRCWQALPLTPWASLADVRQTLKDFDFNLDFSRWSSDDDMQDFAYFLQWLLSSSDMKYLTRLDRSPSAQGRPARREEISITWDDKCPEAFVREFIQRPRAADYQALHVELQNRTKTTFHLVPSSSIQDSNQMREDDVIILCMGESASGMINLIDALARKPINITLGELSMYANTEFLVTRALHRRDGRNIVLVNTPRPLIIHSTTLEMDRVLGMFRTWLAKISAKIGPRPCGVIYLQPDRRSSLSKVHQKFCALRSCSYKTYNLIDPQVAWQVVDELICLVEANVLHELLNKTMTRMGLSAINKAKPLSKALAFIDAVLSQVEKEDNLELKDMFIQEIQSRIKNITKDISVTLQSVTQARRLIVRMLLPFRELENLCRYDELL